MEKYNMTLQELKDRSQRMIATNRSGRVAEIEQEYIIQLVERCEKLSEALASYIDYSNDLESYEDTVAGKALLLYGPEVPLK